MDKFQKEVLEKLDKIIELLSENQKSKKMLLEDGGQYFGRQKANYPKDVYGGDTFYCSVIPQEYDYSSIAASTSIDLSNLKYTLNYKED